MAVQKALVAAATGVLAPVGRLLGYGAPHLRRPFVSLDVLPQSPD